MEEERVLIGPTDNWKSIQVPLGTRLTSSLKSLHQQVIQVFPDENNHRSTAEWILRRAASESAQLSLKPKDVVGIVTSNSPHFAPGLLAILCAGAIGVPIGFSLPLEDLNKIIGNLSPRLIMCSEDMRARVSSAFPSVPLHVLGRAFKTALAEPKVVAVDNYASAAAFYLSTSGSTGLPKKVALSQAVIDAFLNSCRRPDLGLAKTDVLITAAPIFWYMGFILQVICLDTGLRLVIPAKFEPLSFLQYAEQYKATLLQLNVTNLARLCKEELLRLEALSTVRCVLSAGTCLNARIERFIEDTLKKPLVQWYGITETQLPISAPLVPPYKTPPGSVGTVKPWCKIKVVDLVSGEAVTAGVDGELLIKCPFISSNLPSDDWAHSGDYGHYDDEGNFYIVDRVVDLIQLRGTLVAPSEVECALLMHPSVKDAVVVGVPDDVESALLTAVVSVMEGETVSPDDLQRHVASTLKDRRMHLQGGVVFVEAVPKTPTGKPKRRTARALCADIFGRQSVSPAK